MPDQNPMPSGLTARSGHILCTSLRFDFGYLKSRLSTVVDTRAAVAPLLLMPLTVEVVVVL